MENRTEIGKAIKNKLADLDKTPNDFVWSKIETDLNKKRNKRLLFWLIPSVAAIAFLSSLLYYNFDFQDKNQKQEVSAKKELKTEVSNSKSNKTSVQSINSNPNLKKSGSDETTTIKKTKSIKLVKESSKLVSTTNEYEEYEVVKKYKVVIKKEQINTKPLKLSAAKKTTKPSLNKSKKAVIKTNKTLKKNSTKTIINNSTKNNKKIATKPLIVKNPKNRISEKDTLKYNNTEIVPEICEIKKDTIAKIDSLNSKKTTTPKREYIKKEYINKTTESNPDFSVHIFYGPAIFGSLNSESMINPTLNNLSKSHPITSHYGIYVKNMYDRIGFRAGFSKINLKISTRLDQNLITNFNNIALKSDVNIQQTFGNSNNIDLVQKLSYYELPMEFNYAIIKNETKIGMDVFTGFSFLILDKNQLYLKSENVSMQHIGEAKNISGVNISYNLGLSISYKLNDKFGLDINPLFKYYLSTFKENGDAKPYSFALQTGVNYKF
ncbi:hypothetical protein D3C86_606340 [compost metagenome]